MQKYDLIVAGGGFSGVAAAVCAARGGLRVLLVEKEGHLGGAMSNCLIYPFMPVYTTDPKSGQTKHLAAGLFQEIQGRARQTAQMLGEQVGVYYTVSPECYKLVLDELTEEAGVTVLFHAEVTAVETQAQKLQAVTVYSGSRTMRMEADFFVDATGDGNLFALAGCAYERGRPEDGLCQPMTTCFRLAGVDVELFFEEIAQVQKLYKAQRAAGQIANPREDILWIHGIGSGIMHFNTTRVIKHDPEDPFSLSRAAVEARKQVGEMVMFLKKHAASCKNATLVSIAPNIGVRESRRLCGKHMLTVQELIDRKVFRDSIAIANYDIDIHNPAGSGTSHYFFKPGEYYTIPYASLLPVEFDNLLVAGRCISATHEAQASVRVMPICCCMGEAVGTAIALAAKTGRTVHTVDVSTLQQKLQENGALIF